MYLVIIEGESFDENSVATVNTLAEVNRFVEIFKKLKPEIMTTKSGPIITGYTWNNSQYALDDDDPDYYSTLYKDVLSQEDIEWFNSYMPDGEMGIVRIESILIHQVVGTEVLL